MLEINRVIDIIINFKRTNSYKFLDWDTLLVEALFKKLLQTISRNQIYIYSR